MQMFLWGASPFGDFFHVISQSSGDTDLVDSYYASRFPFYSIPRTDTPDNLPFEVALVLVEDNGLPYTGLNVVVLQEKARTLVMGVQRIQPLVQKQ